MEATNDQIRWAREATEAQPETPMGKTMDSCLRSMSRPVLVACRNLEVLRAFRLRYRLAPPEVVWAHVGMDTQWYETPWARSKVLIVIPGWEMNAGVKEFVQWWDADERYTYTLNDEPESFVERPGISVPLLRLGILCFGLACALALAIEFNWFLCRDFRVLVPWLLAFSGWMTAYAVVGREMRSDR